MRISLNQNLPIGDSVPYEGSLTLSAELLARPNVLALSPVRFSGFLQRTEDGVLAEGKVTYSLTTLCDSCLTQVVREADFPFSEFFGKEDSESEYTLEGQFLDLSKAVTDALLYELPVRIVCIDDCKGLCPVCGINRNQASCNCEALPDENNPFYALIKAQNDNK